MDQEREHSGHAKPAATNFSISAAAACCSLESIPLRMRASLALCIDENCVAWQWLCHQLAFLGRVEHEFGVVHAQRIQDVLLHEVIERLA
jgi:hypothetical protein